MLVATCFVFPGAVAPALAADAPAQAIRLTSPLDYQVFQRSTRTDGAIVVCGQVLVDCDAVQAKVTGRPAEGTLDERWRDVPLQADKKTFRGELSVPTGGWYKIEVKVRYGNKPDAETIAVNHVGVGEVFIVAGQSNAANHGDGHQKPASGLVAAFDGTRWVIANDPQPGASGNGGSFIPAFGDAMAERCKVPIGVANVAVGATKALHWYPKSAAVDVEVTTKASPDKPEIRKMASNGGLYANLLARVKTLGKEGFRAVLWHQGESDANQLPYGHQDWDITGKGYRRLMEDIIIACRRDAGWEVPWIVARVSYHLPNDPSSAPVRDAQKSLWDDKVALEGPDTDTLTGDLRSGVHFNPKGLQAHGKMWAEKVGAYVDKALAAPK